jgi:hypothetical protein
MKNLQEATEMICDLKGSVIALDALVTALIHQMPAESRAELLREFNSTAEMARTVLVHAPISDQTIAGFERDVERFAALIDSQACSAP